MVMRQRLQQSAERMAQDASSEPQPQMIPVEPVEGEHWELIENLRYRFDGRRARWEPRKGMEKILSLSTGDIRALYPIRIVASATVYRIFIIQNYSGFIRALNDDGEQIGPAFSGSGNNIYVGHIANEVYVFDPDHGRYKVLDVEGEAWRDWGSSRSTNIISAEWIINDSEYSGDPRNNIWGFSTGSEVIRFYNRYSRGDNIVGDIESEVSYVLAADTVYEIIVGSADGDTVTIDEEVYNDTTFLYVVGNETEWVKVTVEDFVGIRVAHGGYITEKGIHGINFTSRVTTINTHVTDGLFGGLQVTFPEERTYGTGPDELCIPASADFRRNYEGVPSAKKLNKEAGVVDDDDYSEPVLYRVYQVVDMLSNGSYLPPGKPVFVKARATELFNETGGALRKMGVSLELSNPDYGVAKRYLLATRFQATLNDAFAPSTPHYPNSPFFVAQELSAETTKAQDFTPDNDLIRPGNEVLSISAGIVTMYRPGDYQPAAMIPIKGALITAGATINRPTPLLTTLAGNTSATIFRSNAGSDGEAKSFSFTFIYTDNTRSDSFSLSSVYEDSEFELYNLNSQVQAVLIYEQVDGSPVVRKRFGQGDPEFVGKPFRIRDGDHLNETPDFPDIREQVTVFDEVRFLVAPEQFPISGAARIEGGRKVRRLAPLRFDTDRTQMRLQLIVFTDNDVQRGFITENQGVVQFDFDVIDRHYVIQEGTETKVAGEQVFYQSSNGICVISGDQVQMLIDKRRMPFTDHRMTGIALYGRENELWFSFDNGNVAVFDLIHRGVRRFVFSELTGVADNGEDAFGFSGAYVLKAEQAKDDFFGGAIEGAARTRELTSRLARAHIIEVSVSGKAKLHPEVHSEEDPLVYGEKDLPGSFYPQTSVQAPRLHLKFMFVGYTEGFVDGIRYEGEGFEHDGMMREHI